MTFIKRIQMIRFGGTIIMIGLVNMFLALTKKEPLIFFGIIHMR